MEKKDSYLGVGLQFPVLIDGSGNPSYIAGKDLVRQSVLEILKTGVRTRFMLPDYGSQFSLFLFDQNDSVLREALVQAAFDALQWEKRIKLKNVFVSTNNIERIDLTLVYIILQSQDTDTLIAPFYKTAIL